MGGTSRVGVGPRPSACPGRKTGCQRSLCSGAPAFQTAVAPGPGMELASERASGHCGLVPPEDSWRRTWQVRPGPGQHKLSPALSLLAHRPLWARVRGCCETFLPPPWGERRVETEVPESASSTHTLTAALASDVYGTRRSPGGSQSDRGIISFWNAPPSRSLSRVLSCPLPATFARRGWAGRSRVAPPLPFQAASARCPSNPLLVPGHP